MSRVKVYRVTRKVSDDPHLIVYFALNLTLETVLSKVSDSLFISREMVVS